jgi:protein-S-isoprenylcysteine O-methyltransferase Ste14
MSTAYLISAGLVLVAAFVIFRVFVRRDYIRNGRLTPFSGFLELLVFGLWAYVAYIHRPSDWPALHVGPLVRVLGWICFAGGLAIAAVAVAELGLARSFGRKVDVLNRSGLYGATRNPQVVAFGLAMVGYAVLWPSWHDLGSVVLYAAIAHVMVLTEEEHLRDRHGEEYVRYCARVSRYLGFPRGG